MSAEQTGAEAELRPTPGQTVGPFFGYGLPYEGGPELVHPHSPGAILLEGMVYDGAGEPIPDSLVEIWQADQEGRIPDAGGSLHRDHHTFTGFGRAATTADGHYEFWTREPAPVDGRAPFIAVVLFARGLLDRLHTRIYLPGSPALETDSFLTSLTEDERATLVATRTPEGNLLHDFHLQGEKETVFLAF